MVKYLGIQRLNEVGSMFRHALTCLDLSSIGVCARLLKQYCCIHFKRVFRAVCVEKPWINELTLSSASNWIKRRRKPMKCWCKCMGWMLRAENVCMIGLHAFAQARNRWR